MRGTRSSYPGSARGIALDGLEDLLFANLPEVPTLLPVLQDWDDKFFEHYEHGFTSLVKKIILAIRNERHRFIRHDQRRYTHVAFHVKVDLPCLLLTQYLFHSKTRNRLVFYFKRFISTWRCLGQKWNSIKSLQEKKQGGERLSEEKTILACTPRLHREECM